MSLTWENKCDRCGRQFVSWCSEQICSYCWTASDSKKRKEYEDRIKREDEDLIKHSEQERFWKLRAEAAEKKLSKLPKWLNKLL